MTERTFAGLVKRDEPEREPSGVEILELRLFGNGSNAFTTGSGTGELHPSFLRDHVSNLQLC